MTELKQQDVIKLSSGNKKYNGYFLISAIHATEIRLQKPPNEQFILKITNGIIEDIDTCTLVYSAPPVGYAQNHDFLPDKRISITFSAEPDETFSGIVIQLEQDMITVKLDNDKTIYIDFEYSESLPPYILSIVSSDEFVLEEGDYFVLPENEHRYAVEHQLSDLMDTLLSKRQSMRDVQSANRTVKRFKELRSLFTSELEPVYTQDKMVIQPFQVKWIVPVATIQRIRYEGKNDKADEMFIRQMSDQQQQLNTSYAIVYRQILNALCPFVIKQGTEIAETMPVFLKDQLVYKTPKTTGGKVFTTVDWMTQVLTQPYRNVLSCPEKKTSRIKEFALKTAPECAVMNEYYALPSYMVDYTRGYMPSTSMLQKFQTNAVAPFIELYPKGTRYESIEDCVPSIQSALDTTEPFYSIQPFIKHAEPFCIYKKDVHVAQTEDIQSQLRSNIKTYKRKYKYPLYVPKAGKTESEKSAFHQFHGDAGSLYAITQSQTFGVDSAKKIEQHVDKALEKKISPPIVKVYATLDAVKRESKKGDGPDVPIFYDAEFDKTEYDDILNETPKEQLTYFMNTLHINPKQAATYLPFIQDKRKPIINGEYAQLKDGKNNTFYKRVNGTWKLDETCSGPYPCTTNEPLCELDNSCIDISFRLRENLLHSIQTNVDIDIHASKHSIQLQVSKLSHQLESTMRILTQNQLKYNNVFYSNRDISSKVITASPHASILLYILQKPFQERYIELNHFIKKNTRIASGDESVDWFYCATTNVKLIPVIFETLMDAFERKEYDAKLIELEKDGKIRREGTGLVEIHGGFTVSEIKLVAGFDEMLNRFDSIETDLIEFPREEDPRAGGIADVLAFIGKTIQADVSNYFNFMIHELLLDPTDILLHAIALVLKVANIVKGTEITKSSKAILRKFEHMKKMLKLYDIEPGQEFTESDIIASIEGVSSSTGIQFIEQMNKRRRVHKTASTLWETFLPPHRIEAKGKTVSLKIMYVMQENAEKAHPLIHGNVRINTSAHTFISHPVLLKFLSGMPRLPVMQYPNTVPFTQYERTMKRASDQHREALLRKNIADVIHQEKPDFDFMVEQECNDVRIPDITTWPDLFIRNVIHHIAVVFPMQIIKNLAPNIQVPLSLIKIIALGHMSDLTKKIGLQYPYKRMFTLNAEETTQFENILADPVIHDIIQWIQVPSRNENEYRYYFCYIFNKYKEFGPHRISNLLENIIKMCNDEASKIFLTYKEIQEYALKTRADESGKLMQTRNEMDSTNRFISDFRKNHNIDMEAQIGRQRTYNKKRHAGELEAYGEDDYAGENESDVDEDDADDGNANDEDERESRSDSEYE